MQVYFRQSDRAALHVSVIGGTTTIWSIFNNNSGNPVTGVTVDTAARTVDFASKVLAGSSGEVATVMGTASVPANTGTPACGA